MSGTEHRNGRQLDASRSGQEKVGRHKQQLEPYGTISGFRVSLSRDHFACSATIGSSSRLKLLKWGWNAVLTAISHGYNGVASQSSQLWLRRIGDPRNIRRNSSACISASHSRAGLTKPSARLKFRGEEVDGAFRFHGQTSWQMSQPNTCAPIPSRKFSGMLPRFSIVRYEMHLVASSW